MSSFRSHNFPEFSIRHQNFLGEIGRDTAAEHADFLFAMVKRGPDSHGRRVVALRSVNFPKLFLRHRDFRIRLEGPADASDQLFRKDSTFIVEPGLAGQGMSFRSLNFPDRFIRHRDFHLFLEPETSPNLAADATFIEQVLID